VETKDLGKTSTGLQANLAALLSYSLGWITGLIFFLIEKENKFVRFHAFQSIVTFLSFTVLSIAFTVIPVIGWAMLPVLYIAELILWVVLMVKAYQGETFKLPVIGELAEKKI
jgi:uncharacterized membrane protein